MHVFGDPSGYQANEWYSQFPGMTLRDYCAAKAMQAIVTDQQLHPERMTSHDDIAIRAYEIADAMLAQRQREAPDAES